MTMKHTRAATNHDFSANLGPNLGPNLGHWYQTKSRRPLILAAALVVGLWLSTTIWSIAATKADQIRGYRQLLDVTTLAVNQKNRMLLESVLKAAQTQTRALEVEICRGRETLLSSNSMAPGQGLACAAEPSVWARTLSEPIPGSSDTTLNVRYPRLAISADQLLQFAATLALLAAVMLIFRRMQRHLNSEIIEPLRQGLLKDQPLAIEELEDIRKLHHQAEKAKTDLAVADATVTLARQVAHDIRSPISALNMLAQSAARFQPEHQQLLQQATQRINDIANGLLRRGSLQPNPQSLQSTELKPLLEALAQEKNLQSPVAIVAIVAIHTDVDTQHVNQVAITASELARILSNLVDNAIEATVGSGAATNEISVRACSQQTGIEISVQDHGRGIAPEILTQVGQEGFTHGKVGGHGLGVHHARQTLQRIGGRLRVNSTPGRGTRVDLWLPTAP